MPALFGRDGFEAFVLRLPATTVVRQWHDDSVAKLGGKIFALLDKEQGEVWLKVPEMSFSLLCELPFIRPAPYFARASWVAIAPQSPLREDEVGAYLVEAHRLVALRLTRKLRRELGLCG